MCVRPFVSVKISPCMHQMCKPTRTGRAWESTRYRSTRYPMGRQGLCDLKNGHVPILLVLVDWWKINWWIDVTIKIVSSFRWYTRVYLSKKFPQFLLVNWILYWLHKLSWSWRKVFGITAMEKMISIFAWIEMKKISVKKLFDLHPREFFSVSRSEVGLFV